MDIVSKLWGFCNRLRHDGVDSSDYLEQLTYLLFLKMASERGVIIPRGYDWESLLKCNARTVLRHIEEILSKFKRKRGILGDIFAEPVSRVRNAETLLALIKEIDNIKWSKYDADVVGLAFEALLGKVAKDGKKGAGQYFTPRPLIRAIVNVMKPDPLSTRNFKIADVAAGTGGFLTVAYEWSKANNSSRKLTDTDQQRIATQTYYGHELVQRPRRLALMNMFLHGVSANVQLGDSIYGKQNTELFDCILTNPPFGNKGANQIPDRSFPVRTSDKQLNFIQHIISKLKPNGRAAVILPDSCLSSEAAKRIWAHYLDKTKSNSQVCNLHSIIKLPEGVFAAYANGVKACVIFIQKGIPTENIWIYDCRKGNSKITTKSNSLSGSHFADFEKCYGVDPNGASCRVETELFKRYSILQVENKNYDLSFAEILINSALPHPNELIDNLIADYERKILVLKKLRLKNTPVNYEQTAILENNSDK